MESKGIYVGGLAPEVTVELLKAAFITFSTGNLTVDLPLDFSSSGQSKNRGFAFIEFEEEEDAADAVENMNGAELFGRTIRVAIGKGKVNKTTSVWNDAAEWADKLEKEGENES
jgi:peptidyl-prolyl isomerase E (cyclophilin E)